MMNKIWLHDVFTLDDVDDDDSDVFEFLMYLPLIYDWNPACGDGDDLATGTWKSL